MGDKCIGPCQPCSAVGLSESRLEELAGGQEDTFSNERRMVCWLAPTTLEKDAWVWCLCRGSSAIAPLRAWLSICAAFVFKIFLDLTISAGFSFFRLFSILQTVLYNAEWRLATFFVDHERAYLRPSKAQDQLGDQSSHHR